MRSQGAWRGAFAPRGFKLFFYILISLCSLFLLLNLSSLSSSASKSAPLRGLTTADYHEWDTRPFVKHQNASTVSKLSLSDAICRGFPTEQLESIQVILKIGASEDRRNVQASLDTVTSCFSDLLIFSDSPGKFGPHAVVDVLAELPDSYRNNSDFALYDELRKGKPTARKGGTGNEGWKLDRFKFLPMIEKAYKMRPNKPFYVFLERDTYLIWDNMFRFLDHFDPKLPLYIGSPVPGSFGRWFAHGGSGFVLSNGAVTKFLGVKQPGGKPKTLVSDEFQEMVKNDCCGDAVLGYALIEKNIKISGYFPMFNGDNSEGMRLNMGKWCNPIISLHHIGPEEMHALWDWEMGRTNFEKPLLYSDLYQFIHRKPVSAKNDWDNLSGSPPSGNDANVSVEACAEACEADTQCLQYSYFEGACKFDSNLRLGHQRNPDKEENIVSGWDLRKIADLKKTDCSTIQWPVASVARHG